MNRALNGLTSCARQVRRKSRLCTANFVFILGICAAPAHGQPDVTWTVEYQQSAPVIPAEPITSANLGDGWYRASISASPSLEQLVFVDYVVEPDGQPNPGPFRRIIDRLIQGVSQQQSVLDGAPLSGQVPMGPTPENTLFSVHFELTGGIQYDVAREFVAPRFDPALEYFIDVDGDGQYELAGGGQNSIDFHVAAGTEQAIISGFVRHPDGEEAPFSQMVQLDNQVPDFNEARIIAQDDSTFEVVVAMSAVDADGDTIDYEVEWGDGNQTVTRSNIVSHTYPNAFVPYLIRITASDGRGGRRATALNLDFTPPAENQVPSFDYVTVLDQNGTDVIIAAAASDPDGDPLEYTYNWDDGSPLESGFGIIRSHAYPADTVGLRLVTIEAADGRGGVVDQQVVLQFDAPPANQAPELSGIHIIEQDDFNVVLGLQALDPDEDPITYTVDWGDGTLPDTSAGAFVAHRFPANVFDTYQVRVSATDPNGAEDQGEINIEFAAPADNRPPVVETIRIAEQLEFEATVVATASDPDGDQLVYTFDWGDGGPVTVVNEGTATHQYAHVHQAYVVTVTVSDSRGGQDQVVQTVEFRAPTPNRAPTIDIAQLVSQDDFIITVAAGATDLDRDDLTYTFNWGDGSADTQNSAGISAHTYPRDVYRAYSITITVRDGNGGVDQATVDVAFAAPPANQVPQIELVQTIEKDAFDVTIAISASDPDGDPLSYTVTWGDGTTTQRNAGVIEHTYPQDIFRDYDVSVLVEDIHGGFVEERITISFQAPPDNQAPSFDQAEVINQDGFLVVVATHATDPDGDALSYRFQWDDGTADTVQGSGVAAHRFPGDYQTYSVTITASDGRGGQAAVTVDVEFLAHPENQAPVIDFAQIVNQDGRHYTLAVAGSDRDGDTLSYTFDWGDGSPPESTPGGVASHTYAADLVGLVTVRVIVDDSRGGVVQTEFDLEFEAPEPNGAPVVELAAVIEEDGFSTTVAVNAIDADGHELTYTFDWGDGTAPVTQSGGVATHTYAEQLGVSYQITITVRDGFGGEDTAILAVEFPAPAPNQPPVFDFARIIDQTGHRITIAASAVDADGDQLTYTFDWHDETPVTVTSGGVANHEFEDFGQYLVVVLVEDGRGGQASVPILVVIDPPPDNQSPVIESVRLINEGDWTVTALVGAFDSDEHPLTYSFDWGDGSDVETRGDGLAAHEYPTDVYRSYTVTVTVDDGFGGLATMDAEIDFPHPAPNQAPVIDSISVAVGVRGETELSVAAFDPDGDALSYAVHWGDEAEDDATTAVPGGRAIHAYALPMDGAAYQGFVDVSDTAGNTTRGRFVTVIADQPTTIRGVEESLQGNGAASLNVVADDPDGNEFLLFSYDFDNDGEYEISNSVHAQANHQYSEPGEYRYRIRVQDSWSNAAIETVGELTIPEWRQDNREPIIDQLSIEIGPHGAASLSVQSRDPDGDALQYFVQWGDENEPDESEAFVNGIAEHQYAYRATLRPYEGRVRVIDTHGAFVEADFRAQIQDLPTRIDDLTTVHNEDNEYEVRVVASDADGASLTYAYDFQGDGVWDVDNSPSAVARHAYAEPGDYRLRVRVTDTWSGLSTIGTRNLRVSPWLQENRPPQFDGFELTQGPGGHVEIEFAVSDPDGDSIDSFVRWGDEDDPGARTRIIDADTDHRYAYRSPQVPYFGRLIIMDSRGAETHRDFTVESIDVPTEIRSFESERIREGTWLMRVNASDPDSEGGLRYSFDFDADGVWDLENSESPQIVHTFGAVGRRPVGIRVLDPWSNRHVDGVYVVGDDRVGTPNLPPQINSVAIDVAPGGVAKLRVDAFDPEGGELTVTADWGDGQNGQPDPVVGFEASHVYPYPVDGQQYDGRLFVTDASGLTAEHEFVVDVIDAPTRVDQVTLTVLRNGTVFVAVSASDPDTAQLEYAFDMNGDGLFEAAGLYLGEFVHEYEGGGTYEVVVAVTDPWSGTVKEVEQVFVLEPWLRSAPFADDHLEGEEGRCLVLRVAQGRVTSETGPAACERDQNPNPDDWRWDFGDGTVARGSEVGHIYPRDGIYSVAVTGGTPSQPIESVIEVLIVNVAPSFVTEPPEDAAGGETYFYTVEISDQGPQDEVQLELTGGPEEMDLVPLGGRKWQLSWDVPRLMDGSVEVELTASDGRTVDGVWRPDGGVTVQRYRLSIAPMIIPDAAPPEPDAYIPSFREIQGDKLGCISGQGDNAPLSIFALLIIMGFIRLKRRHL
ncbi:MAG: PKD domain-containing protein [Myxococcota bacterium]|nr:PKD domain-containing protein [Myxococcota bacterium]